LNPGDPIDVLIPTYNSAQFLDEALRSVKRSVPVNRIVAVDHFSTDGTIQILRKHGAEVYFEGKSLGYARQLLIENAVTNVFMMLDSDVVIEADRWYPRALELLNRVVDGRGKIGAVALIPSLGPPIPLKKYTEFWWRLIPSLGRNFFLCHATLFLKDAVEGIRIPESLGAAEDVYVWLHIRRRGYATRTMRVNGTHHFVMSERKGYWMGANLRILKGLLGNEVTPFVLRNVLLYPLLAFMAAVGTRDPEVFSYNIKRWYGYLQGYMHPGTFWQMTRAGEAGP
jgi:glycosyltransferase involved in cell wall biosynthesis